MYIVNTLYIIAPKRGENANYPQSRPHRNPELSYITVNIYLLLNFYQYSLPNFYVSTYILRNGILLILILIDLIIL